MLVVCWCAWKLMVDGSIVVTYGTNWSLTLRFDTYGLDSLHHLDTQRFKIKRYLFLPYLYLSTSLYCTDSAERGSLVNLISFVAFQTGVLLSYPALVMGYCLPVTALMTTST